MEHPIGRVFNSIFLGLLTNQPTLRDVEDMIESLGFWARQFVDRKVSDTTMDAELTSALSKPCIDQQPHHVGSNDMGTCEAFVTRLHETYGHSDMFSVLDFDAGFTSLANADCVNSLGYGYIFGLKDNQPDLQTEAQRLLLSKTTGESAEAQSKWENRNGKKIRRLLWRSSDIAGYPTSAGNWEHLRQVWLVRQETMDKDESITIEDRYFITSLTWNYIKPEQILLVVRNHWGIENDTFNSLDLQWQEDNRRWCTQGNAIWVLGLLRLMAYNLVQYLRKRHLRLKDDKGNWRTPPSWRITFRAVDNALVKVFADSIADVTSEQTV